MDQQLVGDRLSFVHYRRVPIVATLITFGISSLWGSLLSGGRYFREVVTFGEQIELARAFYSFEVKKEQHFFAFHMYRLCFINRR